MSLDFSLVAPAVSSANRTVPADVVEDVNDIWQNIQANQGYHVQIPFENDKDAAGWLANAQAYAKGQGLRLRKVRNDSLPAHVLEINVETQEQYAKRQTEAKAKAAELEARKAKGEVITRGRKPGSKAAK